MLPDDALRADRDTSVDHALDDQIGEARLEEPATDLLKPNPLPGKFTPLTVATR